MASCKKSDDCQSGYVCARSNPDNEPTCLFAHMTEDSRWMVDGLPESDTNVSSLIQNAYTTDYPSEDTDVPCGTWKDTGKSAYCRKNSQKCARPDADKFDERRCFPIVSYFGSVWEDAGEMKKGEYCGTYGDFRQKVFCDVGSKCGLTHNYHWRYVNFPWEQSSADYGVHASELERCCRRPV